MTLPASFNPPRTNKPRIHAPSANNVSLIIVEMTFRANENNALIKVDGNEVKADQIPLSNCEPRLPMKLNNAFGKPNRRVVQKASLRTRLSPGITNQSGMVNPLKTSCPSNPIRFKIVVRPDINLSPAPNNKAAINGKINDIKLERPKKFPIRFKMKVGIASKLASNKPAFNTKGKPNKNKPIGPWVIKPLNKLMTFKIVPTASAGSQLIKSFPS
ncbi:hypothetical protein FD08_GL001230 [Lentilactobacillus parakefiri DSM 10551]|nr:hypothetical protein FD08_GL001230 [Lentilactobacillus parakefiri DSM 10551]